MKRKLLPVVTLFVIFFGLGCYETAFVLGDVADAKVDKALLGDWTFSNLGDGKGVATLVVEDLDGRQYRLTWTPAGEKPLVMTAFAAQVKGVSFMHARAIQDDGQPAEKHMLIRFDLEGDRLTVSHLNGAFFEERKIESNDQLREIVETHLDDAEMYELDVLLGDRGTK